MLKKLGNVVFSDGGEGRTIVRTRNPNPNNPRSEKQVVQRNAFAEAQQLAKDFLSFWKANRNQRASRVSIFAQTVGDILKHCQQASGVLQLWRMPVAGGNSYFPIPESAISVTNGEFEADFGDVPTVMLAPLAAAGWEYEIWEVNYASRQAEILGTGNVVVGMAPTAMVEDWPGDTTVGVVFRNPQTGETMCTQTFALRTGANTWEPAQYSPLLP